MKSILLTSVFGLLLVFGAQAQNTAPKPTLRPAGNGRVSATSANKNVTVTYGQPALNGKKPFGVGKGAGAVPYGSLWQTGANGPTTISFAKGVLFDNKRVQPGKYTLYSVPGSSSWVVMLNTKSGLTDYDAAKPTNVVAVNRRSAVASTSADKLLISPTDSALYIMWGENMVIVPMK